MKFKVAVSAFALVLMSLPTMAADVDRGSSPYPWSGYAEVYGGVFSGQEDWTESVLPESVKSSDNWSGDNLGIAAYGSLAVSDTISLQADGWKERVRNDLEDSPESWAVDLSGAAIHLTYLGYDKSSMGVIGSYGAVDYDGDFNTFRNIGLEAAINFDRVRIYAQAGQVIGLSGLEGEDDATDLYGITRVTYFLSPNTAFSGWVGLDNYTAKPVGGTSEFEADTFRLGGRLDYKPDGLPVSFFASANYWDSTADYDYESGSGHGEMASQGVMIGLSLSPSLISLQDIFSTTGLLDMNPMFGRSGY